MKDYVIFMMLVVPVTLLSLGLCAVFIKAMYHLFKEEL